MIKPGCVVWNGNVYSERGVGKDSLSGHTLMHDNHLALVLFIENPPPTLSHQCKCMVLAVARDGSSCVGWAWVYDRTEQHLLLL